MRVKENLFFLSEDQSETLKRGTVTIFTCNLLNFCIELFKKYYKSFLVNVQNYFVRDIGVLEFCSLMQVKIKITYIFYEILSSN